MNKECVICLKDKGVEPNTPYCCVYNSFTCLKCIKNSRWCMHCFAGANIFEIIKEDDYATMSRFIEKEPGCVEARDGYDWTVLMAAAYGGYKKAADFLAVHCADTEADRQKAFRIAVDGDSAYVVKLLLEYGADVNLKDENGLTALMSSAYMGLENIAKVLVENGAVVNLKDENGCTALMYSTKRGHGEIAKLLVEYGADIVDKDGKGRTALMRASKRGRAEIVELLVEHYADSLK